MERLSRVDFQLVFWWPEAPIIIPNTQCFGPFSRNVYVGAQIGRNRIVGFVPTHFWPQHQFPQHISCVFFTALQFLVVATLNDHLKFL